MGRNEPEAVFYIYCSNPSWPTLSLAIRGTYRVTNMPLSMRIEITTKSRDNSNPFTEIDNVFSSILGFHVTSSKF